MNLRNASLPSASATPAWTSRSPGRSPARTLSADCVTHSSTYGPPHSPLLLDTGPGISGIQPLASASPCDPRTLTRAARDLAKQRPDFAIGAGLLALRWLARGFGYEVTGADIRAAYSSTITAADQKGNVADVRAGIRQIISAEGPGGLVRRVLGREFGM
jgi:hypothetical protein